MRDASKSVARGPAIDVRVQNFLWLFPLGFLGHAVLWIHRRGGMDFALRLDRELWSPGSFMLPEWNLLLNWVLWFGLAVYLPFSRHKRSTAVALAVLTVTHFFHLDSAVPNHYLLIVVPAVLVAVCPFRSSGSTPVLVTLLRLLVTLTYAFAALHKLNPVHFSNRSPAGRLVRPLLDNLGIEELAWLGIVAATLSFAAEVLIPVCLHRKRWRAFGFYLGIVFHGTIAGLGAADYSLVICALYPVFLDKDESRSLSRLLRAASPRRIGAALIAALVGTYVCCFPLNPTHIEEGDFEWVYVLGPVLFLYAYTAISLWPWLRGNIDAGSSNSEPRSRRFRPIVVVFGLVYALNCFSPYVGLKYFYSQTMFSGLRASAANHFFIPKIELFGNERYVEVIELEVQTIPAELRESARPIRRIKRRKSDRLILANWLASVVQNACQQPRMRPVKLVYRDTHSEVVQTIDDACATETGLGAPHPFELYPRRIRKPPGEDTARTATPP